MERHTTNTQAANFGRHLDSFWVSLFACADYIYKDDDKDDEQ